VSFLVVVILAVTQVGQPPSANAWGQRIHFSEQDQKIVVIVEATNNTNQNVAICPGWGFGLRFNSADRDEYAICGILVREEIQFLREVAHRGTNLRRSKESRGKLYEGRPHIDGTQQMLAPGETVSDSLSFRIDKNVFAPCPGVIEVLYKLDFCFPEVGIVSVFPPTREEGTVVGVVNVP